MRKGPARFCSQPVRDFCLIGFVQLRRAGLICCALQVGEALAELASEGIMSGSDVLDILQGAAGSKPDVTDSKRVMLCLQAFYLRLQELTGLDNESYADFLLGTKRLLPKLISKVRQYEAVSICSRAQTPACLHLILMRPIADVRATAIFSLCNQAYVSNNCGFGHCRELHC